MTVFKEKNKDKRGSLKLAVIYFPFLSNETYINVCSWVDYFVLSFFFKNGIYVDIVSIFKEKNKDE